MSSVTAGELLAGIAKAIKAHDFPAVADMLRMLATVNPRAAQGAMDILRGALDTAPSEEDREDVEATLKMAESGWPGLFHLYGQCYTDPRYCPLHKDDHQEAGQP